MDLVIAQSAIVDLVIAQSATVDSVIAQLVHCGEPAPQWEEHCFDGTLCCVVVCVFFVFAS